MSPYKAKRWWFELVYQETLSVPILRA